MTDLTERTALVCGGSQGIGYAGACALARAGARVVLLARDEQRLQQAIETLPGTGHSLIIHDLCRPDTTAQMASSILQDHGPIHILINNAGGPPGGQLLDATIDMLEAAFRTHILSAQALVQTLVPGMRDAGWGRVINVISTSVKQPIRGLGVSNTVRAAMANWAKTLSVELGPFGITVNNVLPGATQTGRLATILQHQAKAAGRTVDAIRADMVTAIPLGRIGNPEEIGAAIGFLASPAASYITGINLPVDGGRTGSL